MTAMQLLESLDFLDDALLEEREAPAARPRRRLAWIPAACLGLALLAIALTAKPRTPAADAPHLDAPPSGKVQSVGGETRPVQPVGVPGPAAQTGAPEPTELVWNRLTAPMPNEAANGVVQVGDGLSEEELAACCPAIRLAWMESVEGYASYFLADGSGGLVNVTLRFSNPAWGGTTTAQLRDRDTPQHFDAVPALDGEEKTGTLNGQTYTAFRYDWSEADGEPWVEFSLQFAREGVAYTLYSSVPQRLEAQAAQDLIDLMLAYVGTHAAPDLSAFHYRGSMDALVGAETD